MEKVGVELSCIECGYEEVHEDECDVENFGYDKKCPKCGYEYMFRNAFVRCHCGNKVFLIRGDTECAECGQAYNAFGQTITHMGFTEDDF